MSGCIGTAYYIDPDTGIPYFVSCMEQLSYCESSSVYFHEEVVERNLHLIDTIQKFFDFVHEEDDDVICADSYLEMHNIDKKLGYVHTVIGMYGYDVVFYRDTLYLIEYTGKEIGLIPCTDKFYNNRWYRKFDFGKTDKTLKNFKKVYVDYIKYYNKECKASILNKPGVIKRIHEINCLNMKSIYNKKI